MHMRKNKPKIIWLLFLLIVQSCTNNKIKKATAVDNGYTKIDTINQGSRIPRDVIIDSVKVYAELRITPYTLDSIVAEISIINDWYKSVWLYKPILPTDSLAEISFSIMSDKMQVDFDEIQVEPILKTTNDKYLYEGQLGWMSTIIPDIIESNLLQLKAGQRIVCTTNLSKHFNFKSFVKKAGHSNSLLVIYNTKFPYIENNQHVYVRGKYDSINRIDYKRPAYFRIGKKLVNTANYGDWTKLILPNH
jgi:hypothetical protein